MKTANFFWILTVFLASLNVGCSPSFKDYTDPAFVPAVSLEDARAQMDNGYVTCGETGRQCHEAVGMILSSLVMAARSKYAVARCTGTLIAPNVVATNTHCLPPDLRDEGRSCVDRIDFVLPSIAGKRGERATCSRVLLASQIALSGEHYVRVSADYTFIELDRSILNRKPVDLNFDGLASEAELTIHKADPVREELASVVQSIHCLVTQNTLVDPLFNDPFRPLGILTRCKDSFSIPGNSGSMVLDDKGKGRALLQGGADSAADGSRPGVVIVTNLACIAGVPGSGRAESNLPAGCAVKNGADFRPGKATSVAATQEAAKRGVIQSAVQHWTTTGRYKEAIQALHWKAVSVENANGVYNLVPNCVVSAAALAAIPGAKFVVPAGRFDATGARVQADWRGFDVDIAVQSEIAPSVQLTAASDDGWTAAWEPGASSNAVGVGASLPAVLPLCPAVQ